MTAQPGQIEFYLPPQMTAHDHASALGRLGGIERARRNRERDRLDHERFKAKAREICAEIGKDIPEAIQ